jgi:hypothetical protein
MSKPSISSVALFVVGAMVAQHLAASYFGGIPLEDVQRYVLANSAAWVFQGGGLLFIAAAAWRNRQLSARIEALERRVAPVSPDERPSEETSSLYQKFADPELIASGESGLEADGVSDTEGTRPKQK